MFLLVGQFGGWFIDPFLGLIWFVSIYIYPVSIAVLSYFGPPSTILLVVGTVIMVASVVLNVLLPNLWILGSIPFVVGMTLAG